tara:strand:- start:3227 stop:4462 length:1236 start_codon:yes stop_codon:yes gene_type:complete
MNDISKYINIPGNKEVNKEKKGGKLSVEINYSDKLENFLKYNLSEKTKIIEIGLNTYETSIEITRNWAENDTEEAIKQTRKEKNKEIKKEKEKNKKHREKISELQDNLSKITDEMDERMEKIRNDMKRETKLFYQTKFEGMKQELEDCYNKLHGKDAEYYDRMKILECQLRDKHEEDLKKINEKNEKDLKEIHQTNKKELMELNEKLFTQMSNKMISSNKGKIGENQVIDWLTEYYPLSGLDVTAKKGKKGDMILDLDNNKYLVEVKNFKHNVPKRDIEKFEQEMMKIEEIQAGLFISTNSNIQGREDWEIRHYNGRPGIFLTNVSNDPRVIKGAINFLKKLIATEINVVNLGAISTTVKNFAKSQKCIITQLRNQAKDSVKTLNDTLDRANENIEKLAINLAASIQEPKV